VNGAKVQESKLDVPLSRRSRVPASRSVPSAYLFVKKSPTSRQNIRWHEKWITGFTSPRNINHTPAALMILHDGGGFHRTARQQSRAHVIGNLIAKKKIPVMILRLHQPGATSPTLPRRRRTISLKSLRRKMVTAHSRFHAQQLDDTVSDVIRVSSVTKILADCRGKI